MDAADATDDDADADEDEDDDDDADADDADDADTTLKDFLFWLQPRYKLLSNA